MNFETAQKIADRVFLEEEMKDVPFDLHARDAIAAAIMSVANTQKFNNSQFLDELPEIIYSPQKRE